MIEQLIADIRGEQHFHDDYAALVTTRMSQMLNRSGRFAAPESGLVDRLVQSAGLLSLSENPQARREAFTIATAAFELYGEALGGLADILRLVLSRLGNFPSLDFREELRGRESNLPVPALLETEGRRLLNTVATGGGDLSLTNYQRVVWADLRDRRSVISSAPTSAGKSFMFLTYLAEQLKADKIRAAAFIVPTRALITQVSIALSRQLDLVKDDKTKVATVPVNQDPNAKVVYVMTQERLQVLLGDPLFSLETVVVDEAQTIGDGDRGVLLQSVVDELLTRNAATQLLFTLPRVSNPSELARVFRVADPRVRKTEDSPVGQNIILTDVSDARPDQVRAQIWDVYNPSQMVAFDVAIPLVHPDQKLVYLAWHFGRGSQNIIYGDSRSRCERLSTLLCDVIDGAANQPPVDEALQKRRLELAKFVKEHVHPKFVLADAVLKGVGFHYGHIPTLVRRAVEEAFEEGTLDFIVCTSTLLQGVNLPARNIFMSNPEKGEKPLNAVDFWNLAGRAGRLGKEFEGNVFLVDYSEWKNQPLGLGQEGEIQSSMQRQVVEQTDTLMAYIADPNIASGKDTLLENVFSRLLHDLRVGKLPDTLDRLEMPHADQVALTERLESAAEAVSVPTETLTASPSISPHRQQRLYAKLLADVPKKGVAYYMPPHPAGEFATVQSKLINVYRRLQVELDGVPSKSRSYMRWATLSLIWMRGSGLPDLIQYEIDRDIARVDEGLAAGRKVRRSDSAVIIRKMLKEVEQDLRFKFVKQMGCYNALLRHVLLELGHTREATHIPPIPLFLELGASSETMLSFIDLGLSRIAARLLQTRAANFTMDRTTAERWIKRQRFDLNVPEVVRREMAALVR